MTAAEHLATVAPIRDAPAPRYLHYRLHLTEPPHTHPVSHLQWAIEQQLGRLWDEQVSPHVVLAEFATGVSVRAARALDELFDAADAVWAAEQRHLQSLPLCTALDDYTDALYQLGEILRGA